MFKWREKLQASPPAALKICSVEKYRVRSTFLTFLIKYT
jgi:hypothetical protein